jgi:hypothetical protein
MLLGQTAGQTRDSGERLQDRAAAVDTKALS